MDDETLLSFDTPHIVMIYDLISQILDPCVFVKEIDSVEALYTETESIIQQTVLIYLS